MSRPVKEPKLHKLGGADWKKTKTKVIAAVQDIDDLIELYANGNRKRDMLLLWMTTCKWHLEMRSLTMNG